MPGNTGAGKAWVYMMKERLNPLNAYMFLKIMGEKGDEEQLGAFLNAVLGRTGQDAIASVEIIANRTITAEVAGELEIHFIDMVKFRRMREKDIRNDPFRWLTWLDQESPVVLVEEAMRMDGAIRKAEEKMAYVASDKEALRAYQMRAMALSDLTSGVYNKAERRGYRKGEGKSLPE
jgi:hypothetical protein